VIERDKLGVLSKIGQGGQGVVYRAPNVKTTFAASMVYKEYKAHGLAGIDFTALAAMPALVEEALSYTQAERLISIAAWPCALVEDAGSPTGFVIPAIPDEFFISLTTAKGFSSSTAEFQHLLNHPAVLAARGITVDDAQRCTLLRETASALAFLHKHGVCVGDISPKNLLFSLSPHEAVYFIDCDAMCINGVSALPQVETPGWNAPAGEELATIYTDTYKLGLLALRLITGEQDSTNPGHLPATTPALLRQIITDTLTNAPHQRPLPEAWTSVLGHAIEETQHQQKTTEPDPALATAAPAPPAVPIVGSRPPVGPSAPPVPPSRPAEQPPTEIGTPPRRRWWRRPAIVIPAAVLTAAVITVAIVITSQHREPAYGPQVTLPFTGLNGIDEVAPVDHAGVAVDTAGNLYVTDNSNNRVLELAAGSSTQTVLPFTGLNYPTGVAVDTAGNLYITPGNWVSPVVKLAAGSATQTVLPFTGLDHSNGPNGVAVDTAGNLYVTDVAAGNIRVVKLPVG
jgi:serine/threonine protein kinase